MSSIIFRKLGVENWLQFWITLGVISILVVPTLSDPSTATGFFLYRTALVAIIVLSALGSRRQEARISRPFLALAAISVILSLISISRIPGSHFDAFSIFYTHTLFITACVSLAHYSRSSSSRWKGMLLAALVAVNLAHLLPDLIRAQRVAGFSMNNPDYFGTYMLVGLAASIAVAVFAAEAAWRIAAGVSAAFLFLGIVRTSSRGAALAATGVVILAAIRSGQRIPRRVWLVAGLGMVLMTV